MVREKRLKEESDRVDWGLGNICILLREVVLCVDASDCRCAGGM
jgi:hypothetical protein